MQTIREKKSYWNEEGDIFCKTGHRKIIIKLTLKMPEGHKGELTMRVKRGLPRKEQVEIQWLGI